MGLAATPMPGIMGTLQHRLLADKHLLGDVAFSIGGPFHVLFPDEIASNIKSFQHAFAAAGVTGQIYYAKKANKAACVIRACAENNAGVDVASTGELAGALASGVRGGDVMVTGPEKSTELLWLAIRHRATIAVDGLGELTQITGLASASDPARILLRVRPPGTESRFGFSPGELHTAITMVAPAGPVWLEGFSFHLAGYDTTPRAKLASQLIEHCAAARAAGHPAGRISIGGGFGVSYVNAPDWQKFTKDTGPQEFHQGRSFSSYYPYYQEPAGAAVLSAVLAQGEFGARAREANITVAIEPGRALLDQAGCTVFRVQGSKSLAGYQCLTVDGTSMSLSEQWFGSEFLPDPVLWPPGPAGNGPYPACVGGASCLEDDMLSWRKIPFPRAAAVGDLLIYPNTAGYQMDSNESTFHMLPLPPKIVVRHHNDALRWKLERGT